MKFIKIIALLCILLCGSSAYTQVELTTSGTDFWFGFMNNYLIEEDATFTIFISSDQAASGSVEIPLLGWSENFTTTVGTTTAIDIPLIANNNSSGTVSNKGVHLTSDNPVNLYAINHVDNSADATRILPKQFLDINYIVNGYEGQTNITDTLRSELMIVATEDGTEIEINPACNMLGGAIQGIPFLVQLDQGETYLLKASEIEDISGTTVRGTEQSGDCRPFAVFGGSECSFVPQLCSPCDHLFDQIVPSTVWGTEYFLVTFDTWISSYTYRVTAVQDGTQVAVDGIPSFTLNAGESQEVNSNSEAIYLSASAPIGVIQYMEGGGCTISGDPSMMTVNSTSQTMSQVTFTTIESTIVTEHHLQVIVPSNATGIVFLDGILIPEAEFSVFNGNNEFSFADLEIPEGSHQLQCDQRFIANVYGIGDAESYFYSTGASASEPVEPIQNTFCTENQVVLETAENYTNIWWSTLEDPETEIFSGQPFVIDPPIQNQIYILNGDNFLSGCPEQEFYSVESPAPLSVNILEENVDLCLFEEFTLNSTVSPAGSSYVYEWKEASAFAISDEENGVISPTESGMYYLEVSTFSGCAVGSDSVQVNVVGDAITLLDAVAEPLAICAGETVTLTANTGFNAGIDFFNGLLIDNLIWDDFNGGELGDICGSIGGSSLLFNGAGTRFIESADIDVSQGGAVNFSALISDGSQGCDGAEFGENVILQYSTNGGAAWTDLLVLFEDLHPVFESFEVILPPEAETAATRFRWIQPVFSGANEDVWLLDNVVFSTFEPSMNPFTWSSTALIEDPSMAVTSSQPTEDTFFFVETSNNGCTFTDSVFVEVQPAFDLTISADTTICSPLPVPLLVTVSEPGFYTYSWDNEQFLNVSNTPNPIATPDLSTQFTVEVSTPSGCTNSASVNIDLISSFSPFISPETTNVCEGPIPLEVILEGDPNDYTFEWTPTDILDATDTQMVNAFPESGSFTTLEVVVTNTVTGCTSTDTQNLSALFAEFNLPNDTTICESEGFVLEYEVINAMFNAVQWNNPDVLDNAFTIFPTITEPDFNGDLIVTMFVPGQGGCSVSDTITIITQPLSYSAPDALSNCPGETVQANLSGDFSSITWTPSPNLDISNPNAPIFSNTENEIFQFSLNGVGGCELTDSIEILVNLPESFEIESNDPACEGNDILLDNPIENMSYLWGDGEISEDITVNSSGTYTLQVTDSAGCTINDEITIQTTPSPTFDIVGNTSACAGELITLSADIISDNYLWSNGSMDQDATFELSGTQIIWAEISDVNNCSFRDSIEIIFSDPLSLELTLESAICDDTPAVLLATADGVDFLWETNETTPQISVNEIGFYSISITDANGCSLSDSILVEQVTFPLLALDTLFCESSSVIIQPEVEAAFNLEWSTGEETSGIEVVTPGNYSLTLSSNGCIKDFPFEVEQEELPTLEIVTEGEFCSTEIGESGFPITALSNGAVSWENNSQIDGTLSITQSGTYTVTATNDFGCSIDQSIVIQENCPEPLVFAPNAFTPDGDGINEVWQAVFSEQVNAYSLLIFDRDGRVIFRSEDPTEFWIGNVENGEHFAQNGVYNYLMSFSVINGELGAAPIQIRGHITLLR